MEQRSTVRLAKTVLCVGISLITAAAANTDSELLASNYQLDERVLAGQLDCAVGDGLAFGGADRSLSCDFVRSRGVNERYDGLSGILVVSPSVSRRLVFDVWMRDPAALAALSGDFVEADIATIGAQVLRGGRDDDVVLVPSNAQSTATTLPLNRLTGLRTVHLNYAGRIAAKRREQ